MKSFLELLADEIYQRAGDDPGKFCIVLPNRRAGLFLKRHLSNRYRKTIWAPEIYSIEDFIIKNSGRKLIDPAGLMFELYQVYIDLNPENPQEFESFAGWGQVLLNDFNELDLYLAPPEKIFGDISDARALTVWNLGERPLTPFETNYIQFYRSLLHYYTGLKERMSASGNAYKGLAHRIVAENIAGISRSFRWEKILFAGLNALSKSEESVIGYLVETGKAEIFWDADRYYLEDQHQEAGQFIRAYLGRFHQEQPKWIGEHFKEDKEITITGVPGNTGQAMYAGQLLRKAVQEGSQELHRTAVVMADEKMLLPMLNALPEEVGTFNITMGYPLKLTPVYHFFHLLFRMHLGAERIRIRRQSEDNLFYVRDLLNTLSSPYLNIFGPEDKTTVDGLIRKLRGSGRVIYSSREILGQLQGLSGPAAEVFRQAFHYWDSPPEALHGMQQLVDSLKAKLEEKQGQDLLELEHFYHFARILRRVADLSGRHAFVNSLKSLEKVMFQLLGNFSLPFYGEPLEGMQMMGVLETRAIDFENLVILSANEGILPSGRSQPSFIPYDIKRDYDLPTHREKDAIFAYHFYRLLQRARNIHILYETEGNQLGGGERSRFITQLLYELPRYNDRIKPIEKVLSLPPVTGAADRAISYKMTDAIRKKLIDKALKGYSPSALNTYIQCPLKFYFQEIAGLREPEEVEETIEARTLGDVIHQALHHLFSKEEGQQLTEETIRQYHQQVEEVVKLAYKERYPGGDMEQGKNLLVFEVSKLMVSRFLKQQLAQVKELEKEGEGITILHLEKFFSTTESISFEGGKLDIRIKGKVDRIDRVGGHTRVIDYKTGSIISSELKIKDWEALTASPRHGKAFQLLLYGYIYQKDQGIDPSLLESGNISLKTPSKGFIPVRLPEGAAMGAEAMQIFQQELVSVLESIYHPETEFSQTEDTGPCRFCSFKSICNR